ncbi:hypoxanthine phosphoribosyltransferase [Aestuariicella hydrocarbonica]|uniref:Hypoxanthine phosphoribosyltransferase n=1 Tax=Pseudomaricurvus hydrocarbonicus TaxID=1470433 RepID=A0A9E5JVA3_9GAMM|nr:phosphoribosyltransferase family protein [Aestuariicella hydrocarbonica]NHO66238.1 hypoxanthine phosphoribosyltransferase [Aestuariicella hydrocarbonica]
MTDTKKRFITEHELIQDAFRLAVKIYQSDFQPNVVVGIWRGGSTVGIYVQECLQYLGIKTDHIAIRTSYQGLPSYQSMIDSQDGIKVHGLKYLLENLNRDDRLLIVDDAYSSGVSIQAVIDQLAAKTKRNMPEQIRIAAPWFKPGRVRTGRKPDFYLHETDCWLVFPYEMVGLSEEEIAQYKPGLKSILDSVTLPSAASVSPAPPSSEPPSPEPSSGS